ncbi:hypothetical protein IGI37_002091 [Enterococcus sp. AZ194]|uniref:glycosyl hydrolase family 28-related protein n=1 Tax=Enterococcus sp. AZ194 TaxID=2774629 RepID=UPI003F26EFD3
MNKEIVNVKELGAFGDGVHDDTAVFKSALSQSKVVIVPPGEYIISETLNILQGKSLIGETNNIRGYGPTAVLRFTSDVIKSKSAFILMGRNAVGAEPIEQRSEVKLKNIQLDCNGKIGFGVYASYLTNESEINNVAVKGSSEYNFFIVKSWYAKYENLVSLECNNNGIAFGMPLEYSDGEKVEWTSANPLELNNTLIKNIRSIKSGQRFIGDIEKYDPENKELRNKGYGIGFGMGSALQLETFLSEQSGGAGLYCFSGAHSVKRITQGYLEKNSSGIKSGAEKAHMIIENTSSYGGPIVLENIQMSNLHGGIYHTGVLGKKVYLSNVYEPAFLKSLDGVSNFELYSEVLKDKIFYQCGTFNTDINSRSFYKTQNVNTRYSFEISIEEVSMNSLIFIKSNTNKVWGSLILHYSDREPENVKLPETIGEEYQFLIAAKNNLIGISKGGGTGAGDRFIDIRIERTKQTYN